MFPGINSTWQELKLSLKVTVGIPDLALSYVCYNKQT